MMNARLVVVAALLAGLVDSQSALAQPGLRRAAMWESFQASRPIALKTWMPAVLGYELAAQADIKAANKANIAEERKNAKQGGGVVDLAALYTYQQRMREADEEIARLKALAKAQGIKPPKASSEQVQTVASCIRHDDSILRSERTFSSEDAAAGTCFWLYLLHCELMDGESVRGWMSQTFGR